MLVQSMNPARRRIRGYPRRAWNLSRSLFRATDAISAPLKGLAQRAMRDGRMSYFDASGQLVWIDAADVLSPDKRIAGAIVNSLDRPVQFSEWTASAGVPVTPNATVSIDGIHRADLLTLPAGASISRTITVPSFEGTRHFRVFLKRAGVSDETVRIDIGGDNSDVTAGTAWTDNAVSHAYGAGTTSIVVTISNPTGSTITVYADYAQIDNGTATRVVGVDADKMAGGGLAFEGAGWTGANVTRDDDGGAAVANDDNEWTVRKGLNSTRLTATADAATLDDATTWTAAPDTHYEACMTVRKALATASRWISMTDGTNYCRGVVDIYAGTATLEASGWTAIRCDVTDADEFWFVRLVGRPSAVRAGTFVRITLPVDGDILDVDAVWCPGRTGPIPQSSPVGSPIATYYFDPADGHDDGTGNGHDGTPSGVTVLDDGTLVLDGSGSVALDANLGLTASDDLFVTFLFNTSHDYAGSYGHIISDYNKDTPKGWFVGFTFDNRIYTFNITSSGKQRWVRSAPGAYNDGYWHTAYAYIKKDGTDNDLRIDGINQTNEGVDGTSPTAINMGSGNVTIGRQSNPDERYFVGQLREIAVYTSLSVAERQEIQARAFPTSATASYYTLSPLTFAESVAGSREASTTPDTNVRQEIATTAGRQLALCAVARFDAAITAQREDISRIVSAQDESAATTDYLYVALDRSNDRVTGRYKQDGDAGETEVTLDAAALKTAISSGHKLFFGFRRGLLYIRDLSDGTEWTSAVGAGVPAANGNVDTITLGSGVSAGAYSEHADMRCYGYSALETGGAFSIGDFRGLAIAAKRWSTASNE